MKANSSEKVTITVDARQFAELLTKEMPNGYYLEGFVRFLDSVDFAEVVSLPFVGFRGDFQNLAVVEDPVYKLVADGKEGFYLEIDGDHIVSGSDDTTALLTNSTDSSKPIVLGTYANNDGDFVLHMDENGTTRLAISPNNDGKQDFVAFKGVFFRNYTDASAAVYAADDVNFEHPLWQSETFSGVKNYKSERGSTALSSTI
nr:Fn3-like domain-containing protein [Streptococcus equinus]